MGNRTHTVTHGVLRARALAVEGLRPGQLEARDEIQFRRQALWARYQSGLSEWASHHGIGLPTVPADCAHPAHLFYLVMPSLEARTRLLAFLRERQVLAVFHYLPLHLSDMGRRFGGHEGQCPVTESIADRLVRLPLFYQLSDADQQRVIDAVMAGTEAL